MLDKIKTIYEKVPKENFGFLKYIPNILLFGKRYYLYKDKVSFDSELFSSNLYKILVYVREHTHYGRKQIPVNFLITDVWDVYESLPFICSDALSEDLDYYKSDEYNNLNSYPTTTGGTGRSPTTVILANESYGIEWAHMYRIWETLGYSKVKNLKLTLRGKNLAAGKLVEYNPIYNELVVDTFQLNKDNFRELVIALQRFNVQYLHGYPSLVKEFMEYCQGFDLKLSLKGIFLGSEGASVREKEIFQEHFKCRVVSWYGQTEKIILAADFETNGSFKVFSSYGLPSIYNPDEHGFGEIVGTTFVNKALPLIKYRTGDYGSLVKQGNNIFLKNIIGRWGKDFVYLNKDKKIPTSSINLHSMIQNEILFFQIYQREYGQLLIKILPKQTTSFSDEKIISLFTKDIQQKLKEFRVEYKIVHNGNEIIKSHRGKMIMLVQEILN